MDRGEARMHKLYVWYVRSGYYAHEHPVKWALWSATFMTAFLWAAFWRMDASLQYSASYSLQSAATSSGAYALFSILFKGSQRRREQYERWAAKYPDPEIVEENPLPPAPAFPTGSDRVAWLGWTLLIAFGFAFFLGIIVNALDNSKRGGNPVVEVALVMTSLALAVYLRLNFPPLRDWKSRS